MGAEPPQAGSAPIEQLGGRLGANRFTEPQNKPWCWSDQPDGGESQPIQPHAVFGAELVNDCIKGEARKACSIKCQRNCMAIRGRNLFDRSLQLDGGLDTVRGVGSGTISGYRARSSERPPEVWVYNCPYYLDIQSKTRIDAMSDHTIGCPAAGSG